LSFNREGRVRDIVYPSTGRRESGYCVSFNREGRVSDIVSFNREGRVRDIVCPSTGRRESGILCVLQQGGKGHLLTTEIRGCTFHDHKRIQQLYNKGLYLARSQTNTTALCKIIINTNT
jgi:hypothetical protein